jgi:hypothetical protein
LAVLVGAVLVGAVVVAVGYWLFVEETLEMLLII